MSYFGLFFIGLPFSAIFLLLFYNDTFPLIGCETVRNFAYKLYTHSKFDSAFRNNWLTV